MKGNSFFRFILMLTIVAALGFAAANAWEMSDVVKAVFSEKPRSSRTTPHQSQPPKPVNTSASIQVSPVSVSSNKTVGIEAIPTQAIRPQDSFHKVRWAPPPPGFLTADTFNYLIYRQNNPVSSNMKTVLDTIHGNLMLDLTPFTLVVKPNKILVMLFANKESYHTFTNLPSWSGASSDLQADSMYVIEGNNFFPLSVHELTHLYFDGYFLPTISPLWLSEGVAVYMQIHESKQKPAWIDHSLRRIVAGDIIPLEEMVTTEDLSSYDTAKAELWYTQSYSLVDYLLNKRTRDEFYKFCVEIKNKVPLHQALYRSYGMPFNKIGVLQNVWLHDLQKSYQEGKILTDQPPSSIVKPLLPTHNIPAVQNTDTPKIVHTSAPKSSTPVKAPSSKNMPQKTTINKLQTVDAKAYWGGNNDY